MTEKEKYLQIRREALGTGIALVILILFWLFAGFGLAGSSIKLFGLPIWTLAGSFGVWFFALLLVKLLTSLVFKDFSLEPEEKEAKK